MRRSLILTVAATTLMVLFAMLVPMAYLVRSYALEDRLARAALEVQATETIVSGQDRGAVSVYLDRINRDGDIVTTVAYGDGQAIGPADGDTARVREARATGRARVDDVEGGAQILVPVSLGGSSALPEDTPVIVVDVRGSGVNDEVWRAWLILAALALVLLAGSLLLADRLGRSFVHPIRRLAGAAQAIGDRDLSEPVAVEGPREVQEVGAALNRLVARVEVLLEREREAVADLSHRLRTPITALRLRIDTLTEADDRARLSADVDQLELFVNQVVTEARRSQREGLVARADAAEVVRERTAFWEPLAEDQGRRLEVAVPAVPLPVAISVADLEALLDLLFDNAFSYTDEGVAVSVSLTASPDGEAVLTVEDAGPGFPADFDVVRRGASGQGSTGLGLDIVERTSRASGGSLSLGRSALGGAEVVVRLGPC